MTLRLPAASVRERAATKRSAAATRHVAIDVLVCGSVDRGDDGAAIAVAPLLGDTLPDDVRVRVVGQLDIDDLLSVPAGARVVIVDAAAGIQPGQIVELPLNGLIGGDDRLRPRSSHALSFPEVIGLADLMRGRPMRGRIVAIGGVDFRLGAALSARVARAIPALVPAVREAIERDWD